MRNRGASHDHRFGKLWAGAGSANLADGIALTAAPLLAATITRDPALVAGVTVAQTLPWFAFTLFSGVIVDRWDRRILLIGGNLFRFAAMAALSVGLLLGDPGLPLLYAVVFLLGTAETVVDNASLAILPSMVERKDLDRANGRLFATESVLNELVGPPVGSALFAAAAVASFATGSAAYLAAALLFALLPRRSIKNDSAQPAEPVWSAIGEGMRWFWRSRIIRLLAIMAGIDNLFSSATSAVLVLLAQDRLGLGDLGFGLLLACAAVGGSAGGLSASWLIRRFGEGPVILLGNILPAVAYVLLAVTEWPAIAGLALAFGSFAATVGNVVVFTLRQTAIPDRLLGRVTSAYRLIALGALPAGAALGGLLATVGGITTPFWVAAAGLVVLALSVAPVLTTKRIRAASAPDDGPEGDGTDA